VNAGVAWVLLGHVFTNFSNDLLIKLLQKDRDHLAKKIGCPRSAPNKKNSTMIWKYEKSALIFAPVLTTSLIKKG